MHHHINRALEDGPGVTKRQSYLQAYVLRSTSARKTTLQFADLVMDSANPLHVLSRIQSSLWVS